MPKLLYSATMSLDGFIAGPGGDMSWLRAHAGGGPNAVVSEIIAGTGSLLIGGRTFRGDDPNRGDPDAEGPFGGRWDGGQVVLTGRPPDNPGTTYTFVNTLEAAVDRAKDMAGDHQYVCVLGATVARSCLDAGLLDEIAMFVAPVLLGEGTRMFVRPGGDEVLLDPTRVVDTKSMTCLWFRVRNRESADVRR